MKRNRGFTLLETVIALAILALALMAIFDLNSGAVANHVYTKHLTVASLLARSKMTDLEQKLYDEGFSNDDDEESGDFSAEGWPNYKWRAKIIAPKLDGVSPDQLIGAIFNLPIGEGGDLAELAGMFGGGGGGGKDGQSGGPVPAGGGMAGMAAGMMQPMLTQMVDQLTKSVREVHLTVTWKQGKVVESMDVVTHVVSLGPGSDRNGGGTFTPGSGGPTPGASGVWVDVETGVIVQNVIDGPNGKIAADTKRPVMDRQQWLNLRNGGGGTGAPSPGGGIFNPRGNRSTQ